MFIPLHVKSHYSLGYGTASVDELVERAAALGYPALALTDLENLCGQVRFHHQCRVHGVRAITGLELRLGFDDRKDFGRKAGRLVLVAMDETGYRNLCRILGRRRGAVRIRLDRGEQANDPLSLAAYFSEGLFALSDDPVVIEHLLQFSCFHPKQLGLLLVRPTIRELEYSKVEFARRMGVRPVADFDVVFLHKTDYQFHLLQRAVRQHRLISHTAEADLEDVERWLRSPDEAAALFGDIPEAIEGAEEIAATCRLDLDALRPELPVYDHANQSVQGEQLRRLCLDAKEFPGSQSWIWSPEHSTRLEYELSQFEQLGLSGFMLIISEIITHCQKHKIPIVARGSAVSSLVLHLLGASPVDPVTNGLLFERFLHKGKSTWPDVDLDLPWHRRDEVIDWVYEHFGRQRVAMVAAHNRFQRRSALCEGLKAFGIGSALIEALSRGLPPDDLPVEEFDFLGLGETIERDVLLSLQSTMSLLGVMSGILPVVQRLIGSPRHLSVHPGGIVIGNGPLEDILPLDRAPKGVVVTQYDLAALSELGMVKIDLLGNRCLSELEETLRLAGNSEPVQLQSIPFDDQQTLMLIDRANTLGCFQLESPAMRSLLARIPIRRESDLVAVLALIRPGAAAGEAKAHFIRRARGEEADVPFDQALADRLRETHGMLLYEEDIMVLLSEVCGLNLEEADELRSAIVESGGDGRILADLETKFVRKCRHVMSRNEAGLPRASRAWSAAAQFSSYSFNKAHAASYARLAYLSAYMKTHHLLEFSCALLNHHQSMYPMRTLAAEMTRLGIILKPPHINFSVYHSGLTERETHSTERAVRVGLDKIKGLSWRTANKIIEERTARGQFESLRNFSERINVTKSELQALVLSGACDGMPPLDRDEYPFMHESVLDLLRKGKKLQEIEGLRRVERSTLPAEEKRLELYRSLVRVRNELRYLQMHLTAHPLAVLRSEAERYGCIDIRAATAAVPGSRLRLTALIAAMRRVPTRSGIMQFLSLEDETGLLEAAVLPHVYRTIGERVTTPGPFLVKGILRQQQGAVHLEVRGFDPFHKRPQPFTGSTE